MVSFTVAYEYTTVYAVRCLARLLVRKGEGRGKGRELCEGDCVMFFEFFFGGWELLVFLFYSFLL